MSSDKATPLSFYNVVGASGNNAQLIAAVDVEANVHWSDHALGLMQCADAAEVDALLGNFQEKPAAKTSELEGLKEPDTFITWNAAKRACGRAKAVVTEAVGR